MKYLLIVYSLVLCSRWAIADNLVCFNLIQEPVAICVGEHDQNHDGVNVVIVDLENRALLANFNGRVFREVVTCSNCIEGLNQMIMRSSQQATLSSEFRSGHVDLSSLQFHAQVDSVFRREFGEVKIGDSSYPYTRAQDNSQSMAVLAAVIGRDVGPDNHLVTRLPTSLLGD